MKVARVLSIPFLLSLASTVSAGVAGSIPVGEGAYPPESVSVVSTTTRAEVIAELREAQRLGLVSVGEAGSTVLAPQAGSTKTRAQVVAELREARSLGLLNAVGEGDVPAATTAQESQIAAAGLRALEQPRIAAR